MPRSYLQPGLVLRRGGNASDQQVRALQRDLRALGYLRRNIDGLFGGGTEAAVQALTWDLLNNMGGGRDGAAPVRVVDYNQGRVDAVTGVVDQPVAACIAAMAEDPAFPKVPRSDDPAGDNARIRESIAALVSDRVPMPYLRAIFVQESALRHYHEPRPGDEDDYVVVGLDRNGPPAAVTSRGYGVGQYTFFHHPPRAEEIAESVEQPARNVTQAIDELREKFERFVLSDDAATRADDRIVEAGGGGLRVCKHPAGDPRHLSDCKTCLEQAGRMDIVSGATRWYEGGPPPPPPGRPVPAAGVYAPTQYYRDADYRDVPVRRNIGCDWPYAARRYNGGGVNSYHYQARILLHLLKL